MSEELPERGPPALKLDPKRQVARIPVSVDWHDYLISERKPGAAVALNSVVRPRRAVATGFEYKCTTAGVTSSKATQEIRWPVIAAGTVTDGSVVWTAQAVSSASLRTSISSNTWTFDTGVTKSNESTADYVYTAYAEGGVSGQDYELKHAVTLSGAPAEINEALLILPVRN